MDTSERATVLTSELDALLIRLGRQRFIAHQFRVDRHGPEVLAFVRDWGGMADVVILHTEDYAVAYRTPSGPGRDVFAPTEVSWSYASSPVWTLRGALTLAPPGHPDVRTGSPTRRPASGCPPRIACRCVCGYAAGTRNGDPER